MHLDIYQPVWFKLGLMIYATDLCILIVNNPDLESRSQGAREGFCYLTMFSIGVDGIWHTVRLVGLMEPVFTLLQSVDIQVRGPCLGYFMYQKKRKSFNTG